MKDFKSHFKFNKQERSGIFFLLLIVILFQIGYFVFRSFPMEHSKSSFSMDKNLKTKIDILKKEALQKDSVKVYLFNPNFITDYKGYTLGMSVEEIDRLHSFRETNEYVNSAEDFQRVTQISDSLLNEISPYFKFPEWTKKREHYEARHNSSSSSSSSEPVRSISTKKNQIKDLNTASARELTIIKGIGEKLSQRIVKFRDRLGGFLVDEQLYDVYYLEPEVAKRVLTKFKVFNKPSVKKININSASIDEIASLTYIKYDIAREIVSYREVNGSFSSLNELEKIEGFPSDKIDRIALYLSL